MYSSFAIFRKKDSDFHYIFWCHHLTIKLPITSINQLYTSFDLVNSIIVYFLFEGKTVSVVLFKIEKPYIVARKRKLQYWTINGPQSGLGKKSEGLPYQI